LLQALLQELYPQGINTLDPYVGGLLESTLYFIPSPSVLGMRITPVRNGRLPGFVLLCPGHVIGASVGELFHTVIMDQVC
jgi:hypothetical protein